MSLYHNVFIKDTIFDLCILYKLSVLYILMYNADLCVQILIYTCSLPTFDHGLFLDFSVMPTNFNLRKFYMKN